MPLKYGGLVPGANPKDPLKGTPDVQGLKDATLEVWPNGRVKSAAEGVALPVYTETPGNVTFDSDTPVENGLLIVADDGAGNQSVQARLDGAWVQIS